tara:strand:- start:595 stop:819 length:225 start_codon:yes stop_codon:yes gene_type:complete
LDGVFLLSIQPAPVVDVGADFDGNGSVDFSGFLAFVAGFGMSSSDAGFDVRLDMDESGAVDFSDFLLFAAVFGT